MIRLDELRDRAIAGLASAVTAVQSLRERDPKNLIAAVKALPQRFAANRAPGLIVAVIVVGVGVAVWLSLHTASATVQERELVTTLTCSKCGATVDASRDEMVRLVEAARAKGFASVGATGRSPIGVCPKCGQPALYRGVPAAATPRR